MTDAKTPGERLRVRRRELKVSTEELGRRAGLILGRTKPISASAVRNQENGTNGLSVAVAEAYAEILDTDAQWLLFGTDQSPETMRAKEFLEKQDAEAHAAGYVTMTDCIVITYGIISGRWLSQMVKPDPQSGEVQSIIAYLPSWSAKYDLVAYEVADRTLEPMFPKGSWLICGPAKDAFLPDGCVVVANRYGRDKGEIDQAVRVLREKRNGDIDLSPVGPNGPAADGFVRGGLVFPDYWVEEIVLACWHVLPQQPGRSLDAGGLQLVHYRHLKNETSANSSDPGPQKD